MKKNSYCALPVPLLWKSLFLFIPLLVSVFIVLMFWISIRIHKNKKLHKQAVDKKVQIALIWITADLLSLIFYGIVGLDLNYYLLVFFAITLFALGGFILGEKYRLFKIAQRWWLSMTILSLTFAILFSISFINSIQEKRAFASGIKETCINRTLF